MVGPGRDVPHRNDRVVNPTDWNHTAFALVIAIHNGADEAARLMLKELTAADIAGIAVILAMSLDEAWIDLCERDGVEFDELAHHAGLWLAQRIR